MNQTDSLAVLILAAGSSSRLGQPKQLLKFQGDTLINRICKTATSVSSSVNVILGSNSQMIRQAIKSQSVRTHHFENWNEGMGSTIAFGVEQILQKSPNTSDILILVCDQIKTSSELLNSLIQSHIEQKNDTTASSYKGTLGVPAIFGQSTFKELIKLSGEKGAKSIIQNESFLTGSIEFSDGHLDIDCQDDLKFLEN